MRAIHLVRMVLVIFVTSAALGCGEVQPEKTPNHPIQAPAANNEPQKNAAGADARPGEMQLADSKIIRVGYVSVTVQDIEPLQEGVRELARRFGAMIADSDLQARTQSRQRCVWKLRVPSEKFEELMSEVSQLGHLQSVRSTAQDVSEEFVDITARIRNKQVEVDRLLKLFESQSATLTQIGDVQRELSRAQEEIERMQGRQRWLEQHVAFSTIHLTVDELEAFVPPTRPEPTTFGEQVAATWRGSWSALVEAARYVTLLAIGLVPWLGLAAMVVLPIRWLRRRVR